MSTRKAAAIIAAVLFLLSGVSTLERHGNAYQSAISETKIIKFSNIEISRGNYASISCNGCSSTYKASYPIMPYKSETLAFPFGTKIEGIDVESGNIQTIHLDKKIAPAPEPLPLNMKNVKAEVKEGGIYESNEPYPSNWFTYNIGAGIQNGEHAIFLSIHAFPAR
ncbi:MAG: C25 family peptidase propeptide domain-containing protein, partial [Candidatus Thermoplasmatota archaeon]|nr:C25 family peptidase propeptide domain-containing protein [Candidatus Thermoplasmatota archaeon]